MTGFLTQRRPKIAFRMPHRYFGERKTTIFNENASFQRILVTRYYQYTQKEATGAPM